MAAYTRRRQGVSGSDGKGKDVYTSRENRDYGSKEASLNVDQDDYEPAPLDIDRDDYFRDELEEPPHQDELTVSDRLPSRRLSGEKVEQTEVLGRPFRGEETEEEEGENFERFNLRDPRQEEERRSREQFRKRENSLRMREEKLAAIEATLAETEKALQQKERSQRDLGETLKKASSSIGTRKMPSREASGPVRKISIREDEDAVNEFRDERGCTRSHREKKNRQLEKVRRIDELTRPAREFNEKLNRCLQDEESVESALRNYGYALLAKVIVTMEGGQRQGIFVKAVNPVGIIVFVHLDSGKQVSINSNDLTVIESAMTDVIPYSFRTSNYEGVIPYSKGVAIECCDGICVVQRDPHLNGARETMYQYQMRLDHAKRESTPAIVAEQHRERVMSDNSMNVLPIVSLRDIIANPVAVLEHTEISNAKITYLASISCQNDILRFDESHAEATAYAARFTETLRAKIAEIDKRTSELRFYARRYITVPPQHPNAAFEYKELMHTLRTLSETRAQLVRHCRAFGDLSNDMNKITQDIAVLIELTLGEKGCL